MDEKNPRKHETEEPEYVDETYPANSDIDPWSEEEEEEEEGEVFLEDEPGIAPATPQQPDMMDRRTASPSPLAARGPVEPPIRAGRQFSTRPSSPPPHNFAGRAAGAFNRPVRKKVVEQPGQPEKAPVPPLPAPEPSARRGERGIDGTTGGPPSPDPVQATVLPAGNSLEALIEAHQSLPPGSLILGVDEAGKPLVFALDDPSLGALLFMADDAGSNRKHLGAVLASAALLTEPDLLQIDIITPDPAAFETERSHLRQVCAPDDDCVYGLLGDMLTTMERRLRDSRMLPFQLLILDEIDLLAEGLAEDSLRFLRWIMRRGPQVGIWPLASIASDRLESFDRKTFRAFGFHLYGRMAQPQTTARFVRVPAHLLKRLDPGSQGYLKLEKENIAFSIPATS